MPHHDPAVDLTHALTDTIRSALDRMSRVELDSDTLAAHLGAALATRLAAAAVAAGAAVPDLARALAARTPPRPSRGATTEERILDALERHTAGRSPGVTPESLATLTGLSQGALAPAVSALVQTGKVVRDAWLVRLPGAEDLLPGARPPAGQGEGELRQLAERRAIGDRRATGERRLYDRRADSEP